MKLYWPSGPSASQAMIVAKARISDAATLQASRFLRHNLEAVISSDWRI
jgi:hypothetical protein